MKCLIHVCSLDVALFVYRRKLWCFVLELSPVLCIPPPPHTLYPHLLLPFLQILHHWGLYTEGAIANPADGYLWITVIVNISVTVAFTSLVYFYVATKNILADQSPTWCELHQDLVER